MATSTKRIGRPMKAPARGKRAPLSLLVTPGLKRRIERATRNSGRTMAAEAEALIEKALAYDEMLEAMRTSVADIAQGNIEEGLRRAGYTWQHGPHGKIWFSPEYPKQSSFGFIPPADEED